MCLLTVQPEGVVFDEHFLHGVYMYNPDGIGAMYAEDNVLYTVKEVPKTFEDFTAFYHKHIEGKKCVWHVRMRTHGDIDLENCHPYEVLGEGDGYPMQLMHNGILSTGNAKDKTKSDTWHFIRDYLRPMLVANPEYFLHESFADLIGNYIGSGNKFALMDAYGNQVVVNEQHFVEYNGALLSNTYAWDTTGTEHDTTGKFRSRGWDYQPRSLNSQYEPYSSGFGTGDSFEEEVFAENVFDELQKYGMQRAYQTLTYRELEDYFFIMGESATEIVDLIQYNCWTDDEFIAEIRSAIAADEED